ncbi:hypothetical protein [Viridibacillus arvi]|uniref:hypothetical protein n=1 Tax=Viridibacillus arvi TaxID=263475 RepID=UPI0034CEA556
MVEVVNTVITVREGGKVVRQREFTSNADEYKAFCDKHIEKGYQARFSEITGIYTKMIKIVRNRRTTISVDSRAFSVI